MQTSKRIPIGARIERLWEHRRFDLAAIALSVFGVLYWYWHTPSAGEAIGVLAVLAGIMTLRPNIGVVEKAAFTVLMFGFLYIEVRAINHAGEEQKTQFLTLVEQAKTSIARQETLAAHTIDTITGGDSYCYLQFSKDRNLMTFVRKGEDPLYDVHAVIIYQSDLKRVLRRNPPLLEEMNAIQHPLYVGNFWAQSALVLKNLLNFPSGADGGFTIRFNGRNGFWNQYLLLHRTKSGWSYAAQVTRQTIGKHGTPVETPIFEEVDQEFPKPVDWKTPR